MSLAQQLELAARDLPRAVRIPELDWCGWHKDDSTGVLTVQLTNGEDVDVRVACDRTRCGSFYDVEPVGGSHAARLWVSLNESICIDMWDGTL